MAALLRMVSGLPDGTNSPLKAVLRVLCITMPARVHLSRTIPVRSYAVVVATANCGLAPLIKSHNMSAISPKMAGCDIA